MLFQPMSPTSIAPIPPPRRKHPQNLKLDRIKEGGSFDFSTTSPVVKNSSQEVESGHHELKSDSEEVPHIDKSEEGENEMEMVSAEIIKDNKPAKEHTLTKRTVSLPLVQVPEDVLTNSPLSEKSRSHEGLVPQSSEETETNFTDSVDSDHIKVIESEPESKSSKDTHHSRKISMKNLKKKFKQRNKRPKSNENTHKLIIDPNDPNSGPVSPTDIKIDSPQGENGKGSETDDNTFTDDEIKSPSVEQQQKVDKDSGFLRRMSIKMKNLVSGHDHSDDENEDDKKATKKYKVTVIDITEDNNNSKMVIHKMTVKELLQSQQGRLW